MTVLGDTTVTVEIVAEKLQDGRERTIALRDAQVKVIGEEGLMSNIFKVTFSWAEKSDLPESVVVKIPTAGKMNNANDRAGLGEEELKFFNERLGEDNYRELTSSTHDAEVRAYEWLGQNPPICAPKLYFSQNVDKQNNQEGFLIIEDLSDKASIAKLSDGLTLEQVLAVAEQLASLHAFSLKLPKGWEKPFDEDGQKRTNDLLLLLQHMINVALSLGNLYPERFGSLASQLKPHFTLMAILQSFTSFAWLGVPKVLVHGDFWLSNLLWEKNDAGQPTNKLLAIIDFPAVRPGNLMEDLGRLLATSTSAELRRDHLDTILGHYHEKLCQKLGYEPYSLAQVHRAYWAMQPAVVMFATSLLPFILNTRTVSAEEGEAKHLANEALLDRAEAYLNDFLKDRESFELSFGEKIYFYPMQMLMWLYLKYYMGL